ncbi:MAG: hypothetical protein LBS76_01460 [Mycoplasmataceae bacterium]|jgi:hypothetical protein|nr:hypothetical protein [Mycoplasmataceae bacterium]
MNTWKWLKILMGLSTVLCVGLCFSLPITSCSDDSDPSNYTGNSDGTNWKGYISGTLSLTALADGKTAYIDSQHTYIASNLIIPNVVALGD